MRLDPHYDNHKEGKVQDACIALRQIVGPECLIDVEPTDPSKGYYPGFHVLGIVRRDTGEPDLSDDIPKLLSRHRAARMGRHPILFTPRKDEPS